MIDELDLNREHQNDTVETVELKRRIVWAAFTVTARKHLEVLADRLQRWKCELPNHLNLDSHATEPEPTPMIMSLHALYETAVILLHRPILESGRSDAQVAKKSWSACTKAAHSFTERLQSYRATFTLRRAPYLISYATYVASTIHVRSIAARKQFRTGADVIPAEVALTVCLDALEEGAKINAGVERAQRIISSLMQAFGVILPVRPLGVDMSFAMTAPVLTDNQTNELEIGNRTIWGDIWGTDIDAGVDGLADTSWFLGADDPLMGYMYNQGLLDLPPGHDLTSSL
ncbi:hypothetical protein QFC24_005301 [Naganishia onofrii]|uniref:Uncharacterized protein n=1 Tax=Naganishia onofrii TaxID=1851511 RepID=A0ACC2XC79_9TREE|nr:hypothetical protein QFC24_005301 [Naganishia onofrii]